MKKLLFIFLVLVSMSASAQLIQKNTTYGIAFNRTGADTLLYLPADTFTVPTAYRTYNFVARKGTTVYLWNTSTFRWVALASGGGGTGWDLTGNAGTTAGTNFVGTTDAVSLQFKVNSIKSGELHVSNKNTSFGMYSLNSNTIGEENTAFGRLALYSNTEGTYNSAFGSGSMQSNTTGNYNTAAGIGSLFANTTGSSNTGAGRNALFSNTTGSINTAFGTRSMEANTEGEQNTGIGGNSLLSNLTGIKNTASGAGALELNTTGSFNTANGMDALLQNTTGSENVGVGWLGWSQNRTGNYNVGVGNSTGRSIFNGSGNTFLGANAGYTSLQNDTVNNCIAVGFGTYTSKSYQAVYGNIDSTYTTNIYGKDTAIVWVNKTTPAITAVNSGNVGIGTTSPSQLFSVANKFTVNSDGEFTAADNLVNAYGTGGTGYIEILNNSSGTNILGLASGAVYQSNNVSGGSTQYLRFKNITGAAKNIYLPDSSGTVALKEYMIDSLRRSGVNVQARKNGTWVTQFTDSTGGGGFTGSGTASYIPKFTGSTALGNSAIYQDGSGNVGIGTTTPATSFEVLNNSGSFNYCHIRATQGAGTYIQMQAYYGVGTLSSNGTLSISAGGAGVNSASNIGIGTDPSTYLDINGNKFRVRTAKTPSSATDTGNAGDICWDASYIYICTATNTWKRVAISTW